MKRVISMILTLAICASLFAGLTIGVSAASNEWKIYNEYGYYDKNEKMEYHVVFYFKESYKTRLFFFKDYYISKMKVYTYKLDENEKIVEQKTHVLKSNSKTWIDTCLDYLQTYDSSLYESYQKVLEDQEMYRTFYLWEQGGFSMNNPMSKKYLAIYEDFIKEKAKGCLKDAIKEALGITLPACLEPLSAASSVQGDAEELKALGEFIVCDLNSIIWLFYDYRVDGIWKYGIPSVKELYNNANG